VPGVPHAGAWRTKRRIFTTNYEPKSPVRHASDRSTKKPSLFEVPMTEIVEHGEGLDDAGRGFFAKGRHAGRHHGDAGP
jgi:hypothetical protein